MTNIFKTVTAAVLLATTAATAATGQDFFARPSRPRPSDAAAVGLPSFPSLDARRRSVEASRTAGRRAGRPDPDPSAVYLVSEVELEGIASANGVVHAMLRVRATGETLLVTRGARFFNGSVVEVRDGSGLAGGPSVVFEERIEPAPGAPRRRTVKALGAPSRLGEE